MTCPLHVYVYFIRTLEAIIMSPNHICTYNIYLFTIIRGHNHEFERNYIIYTKQYIFPIVRVCRRIFFVFSIIFPCILIQTKIFIHISRDLSILNVLSEKIIKKAFLSVENVCNYFHVNQQTNYWLMLIYIKQKWPPNCDQFLFFFYHKNQSNRM